MLLALCRAGSSLVAVGERGTILRSDDDGRQWQQVSAPVSVSLTGVTTPDGRRCWACGHGQVVLRSDDGGQHWQTVFDGPRAAQVELAAARASGHAEAIRTAERWVKEGADKPFLDLHFFDADHGLVVGAYGAVFATDDGGKTWRSRRTDVPNPAARHLYRLQTRGDALWLVGEQGALYRAPRRDAAFVPVALPYNGSLFGLVGSGSALLVFGLRGNLWRTTDDGVSWQRVSMPAPVTLTAGTRLRDGSLVVADEAGKLLRSTDDGATFTLMNLPRGAAFTDALATAEGALLLTSARGPVRLDLTASTALRPAS